MRSCSLSVLVHETTEEIASVDSGRLDHAGKRRSDGWFRRLQNIPRELYEAAKVDDAGGWAQFRNVTVPGLRPVLFFVVTVTILASANVFGQPYLITQGRPGVETRSAMMYIGQEGLRDFRMGNAAAASFLLTLALMLVSVATFVLFRERKER